MRGLASSLAVSAVDSEPLAASNVVGLSTPLMAMIEVERNEPPRTTSVMSPLPAVTDGGLSDEMAGRATVSRATFEVMPRSVTVTSNDATPAISLPRIDVETLPVVESNSVR